MIWLIPRLLNGSFVNIPVVILALLIGYMAHLAADLFTEEGLPLLFPIKLKFGIPPFKHLRIKTGGMVEKYIIFPGVILYLIWLVVNNWKTILLLLTNR
jgi:inner membrane protein